jgi:hypothetical protein
VVNGDAGNVTLGALTTNSRTSAFDVDLSSVAPQPVAVAGAVSVLLAPNPGIANSLWVTPNPARSEIGLSSGRAEATDFDLVLYDITERKVATILRRTAHE